MFLWWLRSLEAEICNVQVSLIGQPPSCMLGLNRAIVLLLSEILVERYEECR